MKKRQLGILIIFVGIIGWSFIFCILIGNIESSYPYFKDASKVLLCIFWAVGLIAILMMGKKHLPRHRVKNQVKKILKIPPAMPGFVYICPACGDEFHKSGLCPKDFVILIEHDKVEDHRVEDL